MYATLFGVTKSTLLLAIRNNHLIGWPGLTIASVNKYLQETPATAKGHLDQHRMNLGSTTSTSIIHNTPCIRNHFEPTKQLPPSLIIAETRKHISTLLVHSPIHPPVALLTYSYFMITIAKLSLPSL